MSERVIRRRREEWWRGERKGKERATGVTTRSPAAAHVPGARVLIDRQVGRDRRDKECN